MTTTYGISKHVMECARLLLIDGYEHDFLMQALREIYLGNQLTDTPN